MSIPDWNLFEEWFSDSGSRSGAAAVVALIMNELGVGDRQFAIRIRSRIPIGMGLGSSASFAVAVIRAFDSLLALNSSDEMIDQLAFRCEQITHGTPSGIDNNIATFGLPILFSKGSGQAPEKLNLSEVPPFVIAVSGSRGVTKDQVAAVRGRYERNNALYSGIFDEIG